ncbi:hypothetical protein M5D96_000871 [Drosophila gunungcola]|uniref:Uncharacterized protein n=1 Tax=Drosophila gunungcola TaxID=103775 RepID=A0A9P9YXF5_9MUSC|nr:hypothetical protein M5D96_000871 [Drosophila gunungcola]
MSSTTSSRIRRQPIAERHNWEKLFTERTQRILDKNGLYVGHISIISNFSVQLQLERSAKLS